MPFSRVLFRYVWPFWLFKDATRGDRYARAAAYRHNRDMRIYLPGYLMRWVLVSASDIRGHERIRLVAPRRTQEP